MIKKNILVVIVICSCFYSSMAQFNISISNNNVHPNVPHTALEGELINYTVTVSLTGPLPSKYEFTASVANGTVINTFDPHPSFPPVHPITFNLAVRWNCLETAGSLTILETRSGINSTWNTVIISLANSHIYDPSYCINASPAKQNLIFGDLPENLTVNYCSPFCQGASETNIFYQYQWQVGDVPIGVFPQIPPAGFNDITGAIAASYYPPSYSLQCIKAYRRITTFTYQGIIYTKPSTTAVISTFNYLHPGTISGGTTFNNGVPVITQNTATGGRCDGFYYTYTWELSIDQTNWSVIGAGQNYPSAIQIPGPCTVRRKVVCNGEIGYSNALNINPSPLLPGSISGSGTYAFNVIPPVTQTPASGSACNTPDYVYTWERSMNNGAVWVAFSTGVNLPAYPSNAGVIGDCKIRRKVHCVFEDAYSNVLTFTMLPFASTNTENLNYTRVNTITVPGVQSWLQADALQVGDKIQTTEYFDGLGRTIQSVTKQGSLQSGATTYSDVVKTNVYDEFGREKYNYLPFVANNGGGNTSINDGKYKVNPIAQWTAYAQIQYPGDNFYYSKTNFESSPLSRITDTYAPGNSWAGTESNTNSAQRRNVKFTNTLNTLLDNVQIWAVTNNSNNTLFGQFATYNTLGVYAADQLYKSIVTDEQGTQTIDFKDKTGKILLSKKQLTAAADNGSGAGYVGWISTYYVYDDLNILRAVFQPKAVEWLANPNHNWSFTSVPSEGNQILSEFVFKYEYDLYKHLIKKQVAGDDEVWMVYDAKDRLVLTQDGNQRNNHQWVYIQYDESNRPLTTGLITDHTNYNNLSHHLQQGYGSIIYPDVTASQYVSQELTRKFYDDYEWRALWGNPLSKVFNNNYNSYFLPESSTNWPYPNPISPNKFSLQGQPTGSRIKVLGTTDYLFSTVFYDEKGRVIQTHTENITGGTDILTTQYSWSGYTLVNVYKEQKGGLANPQEHIVKTSYEYDKLFRESIISKQVKSNFGNQNFTSPVVVVQKNNYNAIGKVINKELGRKKDIAGNYTNVPLETLAFDYNIRGWLLGVNRAYIKNQSNNYFGFELAYENTNNIIPGQSYAKPQYTSQITGTTWRGISDGEVRKYDFDYDANNRILKADFKQFDGSSFITSSIVNYSMKVGDGITPSIAYDVNGNILSIQQYGLKLNSSPLIDDLHYTYQNEGRSNKLQNVIDRVNDAQTKLGDFRTSNQHLQYSLKQDPLTNPNTIVDYDYDANGNLKFDYNKDIINGNNNAIEYNHLDLPSKVTSLNGAKGNIEYLYSATGIKLQKIVTDLTTANKKIITTTKYSNGFVYESKQTIALPTGPPDPQDYTDKLKYFEHETGRVRISNLITSATTNPFFFDYLIKDNLGNVRLVLTDEQQKDIYPAATLEGTFNNINTAIGFEKGFYTINSANVVDNSQAIGINTFPNTYYNNNGILNQYPQGNSGNANVNATSTKLYKLLAGTSGGQTGLGIALKVMPGDKIDIFGRSYYFDNNTGLQNYSVPVADIIGGLFGAPSSLAGVKGVTSTDVNNDPVLTGLINGFLTDPNRNNNPGTSGSSTPKAYINWILFDENFKMVSGNFSRVHNTTEVWDHHNDQNLQDIPVTKSGFLYVYVSNESPVKVFFDNLQIAHTRGAVLEENHYYPFGVVMSGISSKAASKIENSYKYNGKELQKNEFSDGTGLDWYDYGMREYDAQIGRFFRTDPISEKYYSLTPYQYSSNDPIANIDIDGLEGGSSISGWILNSAGLGNHIGSDGMAFAKQTLTNLAKGYYNEILEPLLIYGAFELGGLAVDGMYVAARSARLSIFSKAVERLEAQSLTISAREATYSFEEANFLKIVRNEEMSAGYAAARFAQATSKEAKIAFVQDSWAAWNGEVAFPEFVQARAAHAQLTQDQQIAGAIRQNAQIRAQGQAVYENGLQLIKRSNEGIANFSLEMRNYGRTPTPDGSKYSVAFETEISNQYYPAYRGKQFQAANEALQKAMASDPVFATSMSDLGITIPENIYRSPANWTWHHDTNVGIMQLVPGSQHTKGGIYWDAMHTGPNSGGGYAIWGR
jgi:RHS repeat-associated protein